MLPQRVRLRIIADFYLQLWRQELAVFLSGCEEMPVKNSIHSDGAYFSHFLVTVIDTSTEATCRRKTLFVFRVERDKSRLWREA